MIDLKSFLNFLFLNGILNIVNLNISKDLIKTV